jgi:hypothetical protein
MISFLTFLLAFLFFNKSFGKKNYCFVETELFESVNFDIRYRIKRLKIEISAGKIP